MSQEKLVPEIRFSGFDREWESVKLGDIGEVLSCKRIYKDETKESGDIPFYKISTFGNQPDAYISRDLFEEYKNKYSYPSLGDILISASGTLGKTVVYDGEEAYYQDSNIVWLSHDEAKLTNSLLKYIFQVVSWDTIEGSTIKRLYNKDILSKKVVIPIEICEQEKTGLLFQQIDKVIELQAKLVEENKKLKKSLLQKMFPKEGETVPEIRFAGFEGKWEGANLSSFGDSISGTAIEDLFEKDGVYKVINIGSFSENNQYNDQGLRVNYHKKIEDKIFKNGDLAMILNDKTSVGNIIGRVLLIEDENKFVNNQRTQRMIIDNDKYNSQFLYQMLNSDSVRKKIIKRAQGNTQIYVNWSDISKNINYLIPSYEEQSKIGSFFKTLDQKIRKEEEKLESYKKLKDSLLQKMFV